MHMGQNAHLQQRFGCTKHAHVRRHPRRAVGMLLQPIMQAATAGSKQSARDAAFLSGWPAGAARAWQAPDASKPTSRGQPPLACLSPSGSHAVMSSGLSIMSVSRSSIELLPRTDSTTLRLGLRGRQSIQ